MLEDIGEPLARRRVLTGTQTIRLGQAEDDGEVVGRIVQHHRDALALLQAAVDQRPGEGEALVARSPRVIT
jgi:hypothetical protein